MLLRNTCLPAILAASLFPLSAMATLVVTDGTFELNNPGGTGGDQTLTAWFESETATGNWSDRSWFNGGIPATFTSGNMLIMDNAGDSSYIYQSLGTVNAADIAQGSFQLLADFGQKADGNNNNAVFQIFAGSFAAAADGTDIFGHASQPTLLATFNLDAAAQGLTAGGGDVGRGNDKLVGTFNVSGLANGTQVWLRVIDSAVGNASGVDNAGSGGDLLVDNIRVVPEPSVALLGGFGLLGLLRRRRRAC